jgi:hypothetical protein
LEFISRAEMIRKGEGGKGRRIILAGKSSTLAYGASDCEIESINRMPLLEVAVSGRLDDPDRDLVVDAKVCVLGEWPRDSVRILARPARR